jgi:hypothetical protein
LLTVADIPFWRDISLILLALEAIVICLPFLVIGYYLVRGLAALHRWLRRMFPVAQSAAVHVRGYTEQYAAMATAPVMTVAGAGAAIAAALRVLGSSSATRRSQNGQR